MPKLLDMIFRMISVPDVMHAEPVHGFTPDPDGGIATAMVPIRQMNYARSAIPGLALTLPDGWRLAGLLTITTGTTSHPAVLCRPDGWHTASPGIISMEPVK